MRTPGRYVGAEDGEDDMEPFPKKMSYLTREHSEQMKEGSRLDDEIKRNLAGLGFPVRKRIHLNRNRLKSLPFQRRMDHFNITITLFFYMKFAR
jgi:hypothetical protein